MRRATAEVKVVVRMVVRVRMLVRMGVRVYAGICVLMRVFVQMCVLVVVPVFMAVFMAVCMPVLATLLSFALLDADFTGSAAADFAHGSTSQWTFKSRTRICKPPVACTCTPEQMGHSA